MKQNAVIVNARRNFITYVDSNVWSSEFRIKLDESFEEENIKFLTEQDKVLKMGAINMFKK